GGVLLEQRGAVGAGDPELEVRVADVVAGEVERLERPRVRVRQPRPDAERRVLPEELVVGPRGELHPVVLMSQEVSRIVDRLERAALARETRNDPERPVLPPELVRRDDLVDAAEVVPMADVVIREVPRPERVPLLALAARRRPADERCNQ